MAAPTQLRVAELDYDQILTNLIDFMKADPTFSDYDFTGSGLRMLARVLAYVTFYNGVYLSNAVNEAFLDTAQLRSSVVSHARMLGYSTHGVKSARIHANVAIQVSDTDALAITLPKHTQFTLQANGAFTFFNANGVTLNQNSDSLLYEGSDVELIEGRPAEYRFIVDLTDPTQRFIIPNSNVDYGTIDLKVFDTQSSNVATNFSPANSFILIEPTDNVYWVEESYSGFPELRFGNGVVGANLSHGNMIVASFFVSKGDAANGVRGPFKVLTANIAGFVTGATDTDANTAPSMGGSQPQDVDEIRFLAPLVYQTQNRCVTTDDYKAIILRDYGENISAINVFGGEQGDPNDPKERPVLGKVFIAIKPKIGLRFTDTIRGYIEQNIVRPHVIVGTIPNVIDPDYVFIVVNSLVKYDPKGTTLTKLQLQEKIANNVLMYAEENIEKFDTQFRFSKLTRVIDDTDDSIESSLTRLDLEKHFIPILGVSNKTILKFGVPLRVVDSESIILEARNHRFGYKDQTGAIVDNCFLRDNAANVDVVRRLPSGTVVIVQSNVGTIDGSAGLILLNNFVPESIENASLEIHIRVRPAVNDFAPRLNLLYTIDAAEAEVGIDLQTDSQVTSEDVAAFYQGGIL